ncbi:hypothetical protein ZOSMA_974G00030 [Zostera marina]|uniref:Polygalacturonase, family GH28 n=1 Tax=Zostera marina TaxID=29655 RepID=A0A0K9NJR9_ZOSMR|nr:hypothetical protein ZOSMA_974G00030 [Zostera marina]
MKSSNVRIIETSIKTGDDCISIGHGTRGLHIQNIECGPGHGIRGCRLGSIEIRNIRFSNIKRTSASKYAMKFDCSQNSPCKDVHLYNVNLIQGTQLKKRVQSNCNNVIQSESTGCDPTSCF